MGAADGASAGHGDAGHAAARDKRPSTRETGAHGLDDFVTWLRVGEGAAADLVRCWRGRSEFDFGPMETRSGARFDVADLGDVLEVTSSSVKDGRGHAGKGGVLGAGDAHVAEKGICRRE